MTFTPAGSAPRLWYIGHRQVKNIPVPDLLRVIYDPGLDVLQDQIFVHLETKDCLNKDSHHTKHCTSVATAVPPKVTISF